MGTAVIVCGTLIDDRTRLAIRIQSIFGIARAGAIGTRAKLFTAIVACGTLIGRWDRVSKLRGVRCSILICRGVADIRSWFRIGQREDAGEVARQTAVIELDSAH